MAIYKINAQPYDRVIETLPCTRVVAQDRTLTGLELPTGVRLQLDARVDGFVDQSDVDLLRFAYGKAPRSGRSRRRG